MKITIQKGMVSIDSDDINYGYIYGMYQTGHGEGLQVTERFEHKYGEIIDLCSDIADKIYKLQNIVEENT